MTLLEQFGQIDIYLFDQILRGNISPGMRVVGGDRNLQYLLREGYEAFAVDLNAEAVASVRKMASEIAPVLPTENFEVADVADMPVPDEFADVLVCHSVLHFARDEAQVEAMARELWRVLRPGGMLFCRLASTIGATSGMTFEPVGGRRFRMSHGAEWLLVDEALLMELTRSLAGELVDPLKRRWCKGNGA